MKALPVIILLTFVMSKTNKNAVPTTVKSNLERHTGASPGLFNCKVCFGRDLSLTSYFMSKAENSNQSANNSSTGVGYTSPNETSTIQLCNLAEHLADLAGEDLHAHLQTLEFAFEQCIAHNPHTAKQGLKTFALVSRAFLTAAQHSALANDIYSELHGPVSLI